MAYGNSRVVAPLIPNLGDRWHTLFNITPRSLYHRVCLQYQLNRRLDVPKSLSRRFWRIENCLALVRIRTPNNPARNQVAIPNLYKFPGVHISCLFSRADPAIIAHTGYNLCCVAVSCHYVTGVVGLLPIQLKFYVVFTRCAFLYSYAFTGM